MSRPRKKILLFGMDDATLEPTAFALGLKDFTVLAVMTEADCRDAVLQWQPHAVVFVREAYEMPIYALCRWIKEQDPEMATLVVVRTGFYKWAFDAADRVLCQPDMATLRYSLRTLASRKRGPKLPGSVPRLAIPAETAVGV